MADRVVLDGPLPPNSTIGIIGGGQLGRMLAVAAARFGFRTVVLEPGKDCPASQVCNRQIEAEYDDETALVMLRDCCDVITYEFENVPLNAARFLDVQVPLYPPAQALEVSQDRLVEKQFLQDAGIEVAPYFNVENAEELKLGLTKFGGGVLKTRRFGYDGKGQHVFAFGDFSDCGGILDSIGQGPFVLEQKIDFLSEFSVIAARSTDGTFAAYDPATNTHKNGILRSSKVPAQISTKLAGRAQSMAIRLLEALNYVGVVGVEFFEISGGLLVNEFAPRVHNSGHWTREACAVSQFEQHIRAICGLPLGTVERGKDCEMVNLLGEDALDITDFLDQPNSQVTLYGKAEAREGRKMGHVTRLI